MSPDAGGLHRHPQVERAILTLSSPHIDHHCASLMHEKSGQVCLSLLLRRFFRPFLTGRAPPTLSPAPATLRRAPLLSPLRLPCPPHRRLHVRLTTIDHSRDEFCLSDRSTRLHNTQRSAKKHSRITQETYLCSNSPAIALTRNIRITSFDTPRTPHAGQSALTPRTYTRRSCPPREPSTPCL